MEIVDKCFIGYPVDFDKELALFLDDKLGMFEEMKCKLLFVIDGDRNPLKTACNAARQKSAIDAKNMLKELAEKNEGTDLNILHRYMKQSVSVCAGVVSSLKVYCENKKYELISAPYECAPMLISLQSNGIIDHIVTIDQDLIALGGEGVIYDIDYKQWFAYKSQKISDHIPDAQKLTLHHVKCNIIPFKGIVNKLNNESTHKQWDHFSFVVFCNLLRTDFQGHGISERKGKKVMELFFDESITIDNLKVFIDSLNTRFDSNYVKFNGESFMIAVNAFIHPIVFHITKNDFVQEKFKSSNISCVSIKLLSDLTSFYPVSQVQRRSNLNVATTSGLTALGTQMKKFLGFNIFDESNEHCSQKLSIPSNYNKFFTVNIWIRTNEKLPKVSYSLNHVKDTMIDFDKIPPRWFTVSTLRKYLSAGGINDRASIDHSQIILNVEEMIICEKQLGKSMVDPRYLEKPFSQYDDFNSLIETTDHTAKKNFSNPEHHKAISNCFQWVFPKITDATFEVAMLGYNRPSVIDRAERCSKQGYFVTTDMKLIKARAKVDDLMKWV